MGGLGISWETSSYLKVGPPKHIWLEICAFSAAWSVAQGSFIMWNTCRNVGYAAFLTCGGISGWFGQCEVHIAQRLRNKWRKMRLWCQLLSGAFFLDQDSERNAPDGTVLATPRCIWVQFNISLLLVWIGWTETMVGVSWRYARVHTAKGQRFFLILSIDLERLL